MKTLITNFIKDEDGASAAEYALILAVVGVAIGGASLLLADTIGTAISGSAKRVNDCSTAASAAAGTTTEGCPKATMPTGG